MFRKICFYLGCSVLVAGATLVEAAERDSREYAFFRAQFERVNGSERQKELNETFDAIAEAVTDIQRRAPQVSLGGMIALIMHESGLRLGFFNTKDKENSFSPDKKLPHVPKLDRKVKPFGRQPLARYSYQFGVVPVHTSNFRPCITPTQDRRKRFDKLAYDDGFAPTAAQLASIRQEFEQVCKKARSPVTDQPRAVDYYILTAHSQFGVPMDRAGGDLHRLGDYPLYWVRATTRFFFDGIRAEAQQTTNDRDAICIWGGGDPSFCDTKKQNQILQSWNGSRNNK
jgi:hypothetical protein